MKVKFNPAIQYFDGKSGDFVFGPDPSKTFSIARKYVYPTITQHNHDMGKAMSNLRDVWFTASSDYRDDFQLYASRYYSENRLLQDMNCPVNNSFGQFVRAMYGLKNSDPTHIDLTTITVADIVSGDEDVRNVERAVTAGFLPVISVYNDLNHNIS